MTPGCFLIRCHGLGGVHSWKGVAKGHQGIFVVRAMGGDHFHICTGTLKVVIRPLLLKTSVEETLRVGGGYALLSNHAGFHLQVVEDRLLAYVGQRAGRSVQLWGWTAAGLLTRLKVSNCIQPLAKQ